MNFASYDFWKLLFLCFIGSRLILAATEKFSPRFTATFLGLVGFRIAMPHLIARMGG